MKKYLCMALIAMLSASLSCAHFKKKESKTQVTHQDFTPHFVGYKVSVKTKTAPQQLEEYLLDPKNLEANKGAFKVKILSTKKLEKLGDRIDLRFDVAGIHFPGQLILVDRKPGEKIMLIGQIQIGAMAKMTLDFTKLADGTKVTIAYEVEDVTSMIGSLADIVNFKDVIAKVTEEELARCQAHFDPSLNMDELMASGYRGEFYDTFFQGHTVSVWINKPPKKIMEYLANPKSWESWKERTGNDFGACIAVENPGPCPMRLNAGGVKVPLTSYSASFKYAEHSYAYSIMGGLVIRIRINLKPENGGSVLTFSYLMELPVNLSEEGGALLVRIMQVPKFLEEIMVMMKSDLEGTV
jgi:hypothetical protein